MEQGFKGAGVSAEGRQVHQTLWLVAFRHQMKVSSIYEKPKRLSSSLTHGLPPSQVLETQKLRI